MLVVHNPAHLLSGNPRWLPAALAEQAVQLGAGAAATGKPGKRKQQEQQKGGKAAAKGRRLAAGKAGTAAAAAATSRGPPTPARWQLLALSPNVATFTAALVEAWAGSIVGPSLHPHVDIPWLPPLVPWQPAAAAKAAKKAAAAAASHPTLAAGGAARPSAGSDGAAADSVAAGDRGAVGGATAAAGAYERPMRHICIQGAIDARRRDYGAAFAAAAHPSVLAQLHRRGERLLLVGHMTPEGLPPMPAALKPYVRVAADLPFQVG